jgi:N-methylhydantoinase B
VLPAFGVLGGMPGCPVGAWTESEGVMHDFDTPGKIAGHPVERDGAVVIRSAGGGGYGDPTRRPAERVAEDVREGYVSREAAYDLYGVVLDKRGEVDGVATASQRRRLVGLRLAFTAVQAEDCFEPGRVSRRRVCRLHPEDAARLGVEEDDIIEFDTRRTAALRAWVRIDPAVAQGTVPLDEAGLRILLARFGEPIEIRRLDTRARPAVGFALAAE